MKTSSKSTTRLFLLMPLMLAASGCSTRSSLMYSARPSSPLKTQTTPPLTTARDRINQQSGQGSRQGYPAQQDRPNGNTTSDLTDAASGAAKSAQQTNGDVFSEVIGAPTASGLKAGSQNSARQVYAVDEKVIGAVLPLTGKNASIGQRALNAIRMALDLNKPDSKFRLALFDSQSSPELAAAGANKLVIEDKAIALLGGFTAKEASAIAVRAEELRTPYFGFSQKSGLTGIGNYVFRNSVTPEMQVDKLVQFAFDKLSAKKFAILFPNDAYGAEFSNIFWDHVLARGGEIAAAQTYDPKENDFSEVVQKLIGTYYTEARAEEYNSRRKELKAKAVTDKNTKKKRLVA